MTGSLIRRGSGNLNSLILDQICLFRSLGNSPKKPNGHAWFSPRWTPKSRRKLGIPCIYSVDQGTARRRPVRSRLRHPPRSLTFDVFSVDDRPNSTEYLRPTSCGITKVTLIPASPIALAIVWPSPGRLSPSTSRVDMEDGARPAVCAAATDFLSETQGPAYGGTAQRGPPDPLELGGSNDLKDPLAATQRYIKSWHRQE